MLGKCVKPGTTAADLGVPVKITILPSSKAHLDFGSFTRETPDRRRPEGLQPAAQDRHHQGHPDRLHERERHAGLDPDLHRPGLQRPRARPRCAPARAPTCCSTARARARPWWSSPPARSPPRRSSRCASRSSCATASRAATSPTSTRSTPSGPLKLFLDGQDRPEDRPDQAPRQVRARCWPPT